MVIVNLNKYQILLKTVELGSITRAAEALGYTQSAVSRVIADLEREWDMELLTRSRTGVVLSSSGAALLPYVQAVCNAGRELEEQVAELHGLTRGTLRVATFASVSIHWLPAIMKEFLGRYPGIQFDLVSNWEFAEVEDLLRQVDKPITVAVMGCVVNGPGEARHADVGIAGGQGEGVLFQKGQVVARVPEDRLVDELMKLIDTL